MSSAQYEKAWEAVAGVQGWMTHGQGQALFDEARVVHGHIVEIGSFQGRSTIVLALAAPVEASVIAIDPHAGNDRGPQEIDGFSDAADDDHRIFIANLAAAGVADRVTHLRMFSDAALDEVEGEVDLLYIDGAHRYAPARADVHEWGARVADGGTMLIHDSFSSVGVTLAIMRELVFGRRFSYVGRSRSLAIYRADLTGSVTRNAARQLAQLPWFVKNISLKLLLKLGLGRVLKTLGRPVPEWPY